MLQQTQVDRVIPYFRRFIHTFPSFKALAKAPLKDVLHVWQGLGYNRRALHLKRIAEIVTKTHSGRLPTDEKELLQLPGIGPYTAAAVRAFALNEPTVCMDTNIRSVFIHAFFPKKKKVSDKTLLPLIERSLDTTRPRDWYYALMDYGAHLKKTGTNPGRQSVHHKKQSAFKGSNRELRGKILKVLLTNPQTPISLAKTLGTSQEKVTSILTQLTRDGLIQKSGRRFRVA
jgi:A/G-specific adenine glycosylase